MLYRMLSITPTFVWQMTLASLNSVATTKKVSTPPMGGGGVCGAKLSLVDKDMNIHLEVRNLNFAVVKKPSKFLFILLSVEYLPVLQGCSALRPL